MTDFFDSLEVRDRAEREQALMAALAEHIAHAQAASPAWSEILADVDAPAIHTRAALAQLPVTRKSELLARQQASRAAGGDAFGGFATIVRGPAMGGSMPVRARSTSPKAGPRITGVRRERCMRPVIGSGIWPTTPSAIT